MDGDEGILACYPKMRPLSMGFLSPHREDDLFWRIKFPFLQRNTKAVQCSRRLNTMWISNAGPCSESRIDWFLILRPTIQNRVINLLQKWESTRYEKWMLNRKLKAKLWIFSRVCLLNFSVDMHANIFVCNQPAHTRCHLWLCLSVGW